MNDTVKKTLQDQITRLEAANEVLVRQIPFLAQRLDDYKKTLADNIKEIVQLQEALNPPSPLRVDGVTTTTSKFEM